MNKKITRRQIQFLGQFLDVYREMKHPLHYGVIADRLGVGKISAYEMLRLLEDHGLVSAEYETIAEQHGPGRPAVLFLPTPAGDAMVNRLASRSPDMEDWRTTREHILQQLRTGKVEGYEPILNDLLTRIPEHKNPLLYSSEFITAILILLSYLPKTVELSGMMEKLERIGLPGEIGLGALSGISLTFIILERINRRFSTQILAQINQFENYLAQLTEENRQLIGSFTRDVVKVLSE